MNRYLESRWAVMDDAQLRAWCRVQWGCWIDGFPSDRRGVEKVMLDLQSFLRERGKEALYAEEKAAGQARLARKKQGALFPYDPPPQETQPMTLTERLAAPFDAGEIEWKPKNVTGNRCLAMPYLEVTAVLDRLDQVVGPENWADDYQVLPGGCVQCTLRVRIAGEWIGKTDVGSPSDQPDAGDKMKAAYTDSLKRAGVRWGIGRYLRRLERAWTDYNPTTKRIVRVPALPSWALPKITPPGPSANGLPKPLSFRGEAFALPSWAWRDKLVKGFAEATSWQSAQTVHASIPAEVKSGLEPSDAEAVRKAWEACQHRLRPKQNA